MNRARPTPAKRAFIVILLWVYAEEVKKRKLLLHPIILLAIKKASSPDETQ
jgi:hypothetical protein